ncbi:CDP-glycerol glycerophosphotransferase family protein [Patescibacteria group bacterium]|nr:CDP-glycerol glycerophosphotransferase family protein [Patescibacteria group bacterium]MDL1952736.1 hypothetical protein [Candidatus Uhrbacteria bacterium UHB]RIL01136.1 MAG: hypothetical protein DCC77_01170 [Candidatus Uhrbacteria bacterium]
MFKTEKERKIIFLSIYSGDVDRIFVRSGVLDGLVSAGHYVVLLVRGDDGEQEKIRYYQDSYLREGVVIEFIPLGMNAFEFFAYHLAWNSLPSYSAYVKRKDLYLKHKKKFRYSLELLAGFLGRFRLWRHFLRSVYYHWPDAYCKDLFDRYKPDLLFAPNMFSPEDCRLLRYAKKHGITTVTTMKSWDVPTTRGFTRVIADRILVFNEINKQQTIDIGDYPEEKIRVMGFPQFDYYVRPELRVPREDFFKNIGADPSKPLILFAIPGDFKLPTINDILIALDNAIESGKIPRDIQVLARFHPKYRSPAETLKNLRHFIMDRPGTYFTDKVELSTDAPMSQTFQWVFTNKDIVHLVNSLLYSDIVINVESTITLDANAFNKPVIMIGYDGDQKLDYWHSVRRNYDREHFKAVLESGGVAYVQSHDELINAILRYLKEPEADKEGRRRLKERLLYKVDGRSSHRVVQYILEML